MTAAASRLPLAVLLLLAAGCSTRELEQPTAPPKPPTAELWPLGGKVYYGTPIPEHMAVPEPSTTPDDALDDGADAPPGEDGGAAGEAAPDAPTPAPDDEAEPGTEGEGEGEGADSEEGAAPAPAEGDDAAGEGDAPK